MYCELSDLHAGPVKTGALGQWAVEDGAFVHCCSRDGKFQGVDMRFEYDLERETLAHEEGVLWLVNGGPEDSMFSKEDLRLLFP